MTEREKICAENPYCIISWFINAHFFTVVWESYDIIVYFGTANLEVKQYHIFELGIIG